MRRPVTRSTVSDSGRDVDGHRRASAASLPRSEPVTPAGLDICINDAQSECIVYERFRDSEALMEHTAHLGGLMEATLATGALKRRGPPRR